MFCWLHDTSKYVWIFADYLQQQDGYTALDYAAFKGHTAIVALLFDRGAVLDHRINVSTVAFIHQNI